MVKEVGIGGPESYGFAVFVERLRLLFVAAQGCCQNVMDEGVVRIALDGFAQFLDCLRESGFSILQFDASIE